MNWFGKKEETPIKEFAIPHGTEDVIEIGKHAEDLLCNPAFMKAVAAYEDFLSEAWRNSKPMQTDERESVWFQKTALNEIKLRLTGMVNSMIFEKKKKEEEKKLKGDSNG